jgi:cysteine desulfurase
MNRIYLDHNSTTPIDPVVAKAIYECHLEQTVNPASQHQSGQKARRRLEMIRTRILDWVGARTSGMDADRLVFTSGGTESNNLAMMGLVGDEPGRVLISSVEHPSIFGPAEKLAKEDFRVTSIPVGTNGLCDLEKFTQLVDSDTRLVSVMLANNETGVIQPLEEIAKLCREQGVTLHCDATQAVGKTRVDFQNLNVDAMTFSPHKFHGPRGIGALVHRADVTLQPVLLGGFQQMGVRPGTEDLALAVGFLTAVECWNDDSESGYPQKYRETERLRDYLEARLVDECGAVVNGAGAQRLGHTLNVAFPGLNRQAFLMAADMAGLDISTGSACASGSSEPSPVLLAMGLPPEVIEGSVRISLGVENTTEEIEEAATRIGQIVRNLSRDK